MPVCVRRRLASLWHLWSLVAKLAWRAPLAPASSARAATELSRVAVNTTVGMRLAGPPSLISATRSSPLPSGNVMSMSAASSPPSLSRARAWAAEPASTKATSRRSEGQCLTLLWSSGAALEAMWPSSYGPVGEERAPQEISTR